MADSGRGNGKVRLGCCVRDVGQVPVVAAAGANFCEMRIWPTIMGPAAELGELVRALDRAALTALAGNAFMPGALMVVGPDVDEEAVNQYVRTALDRMRALGMRCLVLTAGGARSGPPGYPRAEAIRQFSEFVTRAAEQCHRTGIELTIEPVRHEQSRILNTVVETARFIRSHRLDGVRITADVFHMIQAGEGGSDIPPVAELLGHLHVADADRTARIVQSAKVREILEAVVTAGSPSTWSLECLWRDMGEELPAALAALGRFAAITPAASRQEPR